VLQRVPQNTMSIKSILAGICLVAAMAGGSEASGRGDFNKDGFSDLAIASLVRASPAAI
jgi:hypothetical protein